MCYVRIFLMVVLLAIGIVSPALAAEPAEQGFPLENGTTWVYQGPVKWSQPESGEEVEEVLTCRMTITETIEKQHVLIARVKGYPLDLAFYQGGDITPGDYLIIRVGTELYYLLSGERAQQVLDRLDDEEDVLADLVQDTDLFLDLPLEPGKMFGETFQLTRQDGMYFWSVVSEGPANLNDIEGIAPDAGWMQYGLEFRTLSDYQHVDFAPGLGFTRYAYRHQGSLAEMDLRLASYQPGQGAISGLTLTEEDAGKTVEINVGDALAVTLEGNPTTGYIWEVEAVDEAILKPEGEPDFEAESAAIGAGGVMTLKFRAVNAGSASLKLVYHRPWEKDQPPAETFDVTVTVK